MVDRKKIIKGLECCAIDGGCGACPYDSFKDCTGSHPTPETLMKDALALLKEQEPRNALNIVKVHEGTLGNCPTCGAELMDYYNETLCGRCGQAVKWE